MYLVNGLDTSKSLSGFGVELAVPDPISGSDADFIGDIAQLKSGALQIDFSNLALPEDLSPGNPYLPWSSFVLTVPKAHALVTANHCGASGTLASSFTDVSSGTPTSATTAGAAVSTACPARLSNGRITNLRKGHPSLSFTVNQNGGRFSALAIGLPSGVRFTRAATRSLRVFGDRVASKKLSHGRLAITFKTPAAKINIRLGAGAFTVSRQLLRKIEQHRVRSLTIRGFSFSGSSSTRVSLSRPHKKGH
jgi:hypothetical protein